MGTHEIQIQAIDSFDVATPVTPVSVIVEEDTDLIPSLDSESLSTTVLVVILLGFTAITLVTLLFLMRKSKDKEYLGDRFGFE